MIKKLLAKCTSTQKKLARWAGWFFLVNAVFWILIATNYLSLLPKFSTVDALTWQGQLLSYVFISTAFIGYFSFVAYATWVVVAFLSGYWHRYWVMFLSITLAVLLSLFLVIDSFIYHLFHFHLWGVVWSIVSAGVASDVLVLSTHEWLLIGFLILLLLALESLITLIIWRLVARYSRIRHADSIGYIIIASLFLSYALLIKAYVTVDLKSKILVSVQLISLEAQLIPFYNSFMGLLLPEKQGGIKLETRGGGAFLQLQQIAKPLHYPLHSLHCTTPEKKYNLLFIVVDALRFEALNAKVMPEVEAFAKQSLQFEHHYSGGNATGPGIFSLFYGLPYNYWTAMLKEHQSPVLIKRLQALSYEMAIYRSASLHYPAFDETVFASVKNLHINTPGKKAYLRDEKITEEFSDFLKKHNPNKPFFGFLFYDGLHNYCQRPTPYPQPFQPAITVCNRAYLNENSDPKPYLNRYYNAAHFVDNLIGKVLADLKQRQLLDNTVIIITADHGEEFNDSHQNYWGHVSAYTDWQLQVPFILYWPKHCAGKINYVTNHYELAPTLMKDLLACNNPSEDYSVGSTLFNPKPPPYFLANSYIDYAILTEDRITQIYPQGNYAITDRAAKPKLDARLDEEQLREVFKDLNRYFEPDTRKVN